MKRIALLFITITMQLVALFAADEVQFTAKAPSAVVFGQPFQLEYVINQKAKNLLPPEMNDFEVLAGPYTSYSSNTQYINGKMTSSVANTFTYTLLAKKEGTFSIPPAQITISGTKYTSNGVRIKVLPPDQQTTGSTSGSSSGSGGSTRQSSSQSTTQGITNENLFIRTIVSKPKAYEQEAILLTYKLYTLLDVVQSNINKIPEFSGFLKQDIESEGSKQLELERYNNRNYSAVVLYQTLIFPQRSGVLEIEPAQFETMVRVQNRAQVRSIFDNFFDSYTNVAKTVTAPSVKINVEPLPANKPATFSSGVGRFTLTSEITTQQVKVNEAVTLKLTISGNGNMKLIRNPVVNFPEGFETYNPKVENNFKNSASGVSGSKTIEYLAIPRAGGTYVIPSVSFTYFDIHDNAYKTLTTPDYTIQVEKGSGDAEVVVPYVGKEDIRKLGTDIRYIYTGKIAPQRTHYTLHNSLVLWVLYLVPLCVALLLFFFFRKQINESADVIKMKNKRASKMAQKRLKIAAKLLKEGNKEHFYDEVLKALWSYLSDKLAIPTANLAKESVQEVLRSRKATEEQIVALQELLNHCEFARYAPVNGQSDMDKVYQETAALLGNLEDSLK